LTPPARTAWIAVAEDDIAGVKHRDALPSDRVELSFRAGAVVIQGRGIPPRKWDDVEAGGHRLTKMSAWFRDPP
jgi:hypothetical protein